MKTSDFDYDLKPESIAYNPPEERGNSNLLIVDTNNLDIINVGNSLQIAKYSELYQFLSSDDLVILNNTKVIPARIVCEDNNGHDYEIFLLEKHARTKSDVSKAVCRGKIRVGMKLNVKGTNFSIDILERSNEFVTVKFQNFSWIDLDNVASTPIPPYLKRSSNSEDKLRYQTVFASNEGSVAAPTASLNMTDELLEKLKEKNIDYDFLTLHCGYGTFKPIGANDIKDHTMHSEYFEITTNLWKKVMHHKKAGKHLMAVGTTVTRTLEYLVRQNWDLTLEKLIGESDIFIYPGFEFQVIDKLLTNFHAPRSTPLILLNAFLSYKLYKDNTISEDMVRKGQELVRKIYDYALAHNFKFLSYGDSMLIV